MSASKQIKREKDSLPVDVHGSKTSLLKLPPYYNIYSILFSSPADAKYWTYCQQVLLSKIQQLLKYLRSQVNRYLIIHVAWRRQEGYIWWMNWSDNLNMDVMLILPTLPRSSSGPFSGFHDNDLHLVSKMLGFFFFKYIFCTIKINFVNT